MDLVQTDNMPKHPRTQSAQGLSFSGFFGGANSVADTGAEGGRKAFSKAPAAGVSEVKPNNKIDDGDTTATVKSVKTVTQTMAVNPEQVETSRALFAHGLEVEDDQVDAMTSDVFKAELLAEAGAYEASSSVDSLGDFMGKLTLEPGTKSMDSKKPGSSCARKTGILLKGKKSVRWFEEGELTWGIASSAVRRHGKGNRAKIQPLGILKPVSSFTPDEMELHKVLKNPKDPQKVSFMVLILQCKELLMCQQIIEEYMPVMSDITDRFLQKQVVGFIDDFQSRKQEPGVYNWDISIYRSIWQGRRAPYIPTVPSTKVIDKILCRKWCGLPPTGVEWRQWQLVMNCAHSYWHRFVGGRDLKADKEKVRHRIAWAEESGAVRDKALSICFKRGYITKDYVDDIY